MKRLYCFATIALVAFVTVSAPLAAQSTTTVPTTPVPTTPMPTDATKTEPKGDVRDLPEIVGVPRDMTVSVLNEGGKYVVRDMKKLSKGDKCKVFRGDLLVRDGAGVESPDAVLVRYAIVAQTVSGGCPMGTQFEISAADYKAAQQELAAKMGKSKQVKK